MEIISKTLNTLTANAENLATIYGVLADPLYSGKSLEGAMAFMTDRLTHWKIPDPAVILDYLMTHPVYGKNMKNALWLYIAGYGADMIGQGKYSKILQDVAVGLAKGTVLGAVAWLPAINPPSTHKLTDFTGQQWLNSSPTVQTNPFNRS